MIVMKVGRLDRRWSFGKHQGNIIQRKKNKLATKNYICMNFKENFKINNCVETFTKVFEIHPR